MFMPLLFVSESNTRGPPARGSGQGRRPRRAARKEDRLNVYQMIAYETVRVTLGPWLSFAYGLRSEGTGNVPEQGGALLICNHRSILDPLALMHEVDRYIHFAGGSHGFVVPTLKTLHRMAEAIRSSRGEGEPGDGSPDDIVRLLEGGELVCVFPEGFGSFTLPERVSRISYFRTNFVRAAAEARVPVIPAAVVTGEEVGTRTGPDNAGGTPLRYPAAEKLRLRLPLYRRVLVRVGVPIELSAAAGEPLTKQAIDSLSGKLRRVVTKLHNGEDLDRFLTGETPFDVLNDRV